MRDDDGWMPRWRCNPLSSIHYSYNHHRRRPPPLSPQPRFFACCLASRRCTGRSLALTLSARPQVVNSHASFPFPCHSYSLRCNHHPLSSTFRPLPELAVSARDTGYRFGLSTGWTYTYTQSTRLVIYVHTSIHPFQGPSHPPLLGRCHMHRDREPSPTASLSRFL